MKAKILIFILGILVFSNHQTNAQSFIISTIAGDSVQGYSGDGGPATSAEVSGIEGIITDNLGNIYFSDDNRIRKIDASGLISTIANVDDSAGYNGDGIQATAAKLYQPSGIAVDDNGNVYIADVNNNRIRKIDKTGMISTLAGNGSKGYSGDGMAATASELNWAIGIAIDDSNNFYIADTYNERIRKIIK